MKKTIRPPRLERALLWLILLTYCGARLCQLYADRLPMLTVVLHVIPPALFAVIHGRPLYGSRGIAVFSMSCIGIATLSETLSLRTGVPFGNYFFTKVMGPRMFDLPFLLILAYLGIAYCSWTLALIILGITTKQFQTRNVISAPLLASSIFLAWDLAMEADWSTIDQAWIWRHGGPYFGVPISNFVGWFVTAWIFFFLFALYMRSHPSNWLDVSPEFWRYPILLYGVCAAGNLLIHFLPMAPDVVVDATGRPWRTQTVLLATSAVSIVIMGGFVTVAWIRTAHNHQSKFREADKHL